MAISVTVNKANYTHDMIKRTGRFTASVISQDADFELFKRFGFQSGRDVDKFKDFADYERGTDGMCHITKGTNAYMTAKVTDMVDAGTHTIFIGEVTDMEVIGKYPSVTYAYYHANIKPQPQEVGKTENGQTIWRCTICGYEYVGEELPEDFICPLCKHPASDFEKITAKENETMAQNKYAGTKTEKNLWEAFAGESQARNKYTYFASVAKKNGYEQIAELFLKTAENEKEHAVSTRILSAGTTAAASFTLTAFLYVTGPENEMYQPFFVSSVATSALPLKLCITPRTFG